MRIIRLCCALLLLALVGLGSTPSIAAASASGSADPTTTAPGARVHFTAAEFTPGERIDLWVSGPGGLTRTRYPAVYADANGSAVWSWDVAAGDPAGAWTMSARGVTSGVVLAIPFAVSGEGSATSSLMVTPASGEPGAVFNFHAAGLTPGAAAGVWLITPSGTSQDLVPGVDPGLVADASGVLNWSWTAPATAAGGAWQMVVRDGATGVEQTVAFTIVASQPALVRSVAPASGAPGTTFIVTVGGFTPGEQVGSWLAAPDGTSVDATPYLTADGQGKVTWRWASPAGAQAGAWRAVTKGATSGVEVQLAFTVTGGNAATSTTQTAQATVDPTSATPGATLTFTLDGFAKTEQVAYWPTRPDGTVDTARRTPVSADGAGHATLSWQIPADAQAGSWTMTFEGLTSDQVVTVRFVVDSVQQRTARVSPTSGAPGTSFSFTAAGFNVIERLDTWLERPDGSLVAGPTGVRANGDGVAAWTWTAPSDALGGVWIMVAEGQDSGVTYRLPLTVQRSDAPAASATVAPATGAVGTTFTFTASGYEDGERVGYWLTLPDGTLQRFDHELRAGEDGTVTWSYTVPAGAPTGTYVMAARSSQSDGVDNDMSYVLRFNVQ